MSALIQSYMSSGNQGHTFFFLSRTVLPFAFAGLNGRLRKQLQPVQGAVRIFFRRFPHVTSKHWVDAWCYPVKSIIFFWDPSDRDPGKNHNQFCIGSGCFFFFFIVAPLFQILCHKNEAMMQLRLHLETNWRRSSACFSCFAWFRRFFFYVRIQYSCIAQPFLHWVLPT